MPYDDIIIRQHLSLNLVGQQTVLENARSGLKVWCCPSLWDVSSYRLISVGCHPLAKKLTHSLTIDLIYIGNSLGRHTHRWADGTEGMKPDRRKWSDYTS